MGLKSVRALAIDKLLRGRVLHDIERSGDIDDKNYILSGDLEIEEVIELINKTKGSEYNYFPHHYLEGVEVHIFKPFGWYIKFYFIEPDIIFISIHR